jgi:hypothetical protein
MMSDLAETTKITDPKYLFWTNVVDKIYKVLLFALGISAGHAVQAFTEIFLK